ncbi:hypothetical protein [Vibrio parahaemolyticus]|uniref:hypothetical protein n=1 Tax=Vibrio parahaemolyticus TaxID=670 RepID=UPI00226B447B|nr:hypothetical protein [Vibrio parahaemolyticus]MCX8941253.1 hypothetical protein [Vibrio parahaemolyticus]
MKKLTLLALAAATSLTGCKTLLHQEDTANAEMAGDTMAHIEICADDYDARTYAAYTHLANEWHKNSVVTDAEKNSYKQGYRWAYRNKSSIDCPAFERSMELMLLERQDAERAAERRRENSKAINDAIAKAQESLKAHQPKQTTCNQFGSTINCTTW